MPEINLCNSAGRDAVVNMENVTTPLQVRWLDTDGRQARNIRLLKSTVHQDLEAIANAANNSEQDIADCLIAADPDVDVELAGSYLFNTSRVYVNQENEILHAAVPYEILRNPDGSVREERLAVRPDQNVSAQVPLGWSGVLVRKTDVVRRFIFSNKLQLTHINGLTYDFLFGIARELESHQSMLLLGGGPQCNQPLILRRGSIPYRGFLEGRTRGEDYLLILHLSNLELKTPAENSGQEQ